MSEEPHYPARSPDRPPRREIAALLSLLWPGLGQAFKGDRRTALVHGLPPAFAVLCAGVLVLALGPLVFGLHLLNPLVSIGAVGLIVALAVWRGYSIVDAARPVTASSKALVVLLIAIVVLSHAWLANNAWAFYEAGQRIYEPIEALSSPPPVGPTGPPSATGAGPSPVGTQPSSLPTNTPGAPLAGATTRVTVLIIGVDNTHAQDRALTDTLIVASFDPIAHSLAMVSLPRDTVRLPYYAGGEYRSRINTLAAAAARDPDLFPDGPVATLVKEMEYIVGIPIDYYARVDISGFTTLVDVVGGIDIVLESAIDDPTYQFTPDEIGFHLEPGTHHLDGKFATAYARSRHGPANSDYERARRQQQILLALRARLNDPRLLADLPAVIYSVSQIVRTDAPLDRLPDIVSIALSSAAAETRHVVLAPSRYAQRALTDSGARTFATELKMDAVAQLSVELFGAESRYWAGLTP